MTTQTDYTSGEWELLTKLPTLTALGAMAADEGGPVTSTRELWAGMHEMARAARHSYPNNELIQAVANAITHREDDSELPLDRWQANAAGDLPRQVVETVLETAGEVRQILAVQAKPEEAADYRSWIIGIARAGAEAAKTGFLGLSGSQITARESAFLSELQLALGSEE